MSVVGTTLLLFMSIRADEVRERYVVTLETAKPI